MVAEAMVRHILLGLIALRNRKNVVWFYSSGRTKMVVPAHLMKKPSNCLVTFLCL